ncbi:MAG: MarR family transcriptional regulator [Firmicutes bacterium]|nr:MarR family transcriptional regulator [Bacillota bacterium]
MRNHFGHRVRILHWCTDQNMTNALAQMDLTAAQGHIIGYLAHHTQPPCCRDLEEEFHLSHPTVSGLLARLEKKGFLEFRPDPADRRCKRIYLLPRGTECDQRIRETIRANEARLVQGFSEEEQRLFSEFLDRAIHNMGVSPCKHKEES